MTKRFKYYMEDDEWILLDTMEDAYYYFDTTENTMIALTNLLNCLNKENEQLKKELYSYQLLLMDFDFKNVDELRKALEMKIIIQSNVQSYCDVLRKYGIDNAEKLDQVLFNQRVW